MLRSDLCDYCDAYIVVKRRIIIEGNSNANQRNQNLSFKNNASFRSCISKINNTFIDDAEVIDMVMPMYNLLEYCDNYSMISRSFWNYYRDEVINDANDNNEAGNYRINNNKNNRNHTS